MTTGLDLNAMMRLDGLGTDLERVTLACEDQPLPPHDAVRDGGHGDGAQRTRASAKAATGGSE
jgi:hypothetical protein